MIWFLFIINIIFAFVLISVAVQFFNILFRGHAPFLSTNKRVVRQIVKEIKLKPGEIFYELGAGRAGLLKVLSQQEPKAKFIALEYAWLPYFLARLQNTFSKAQIKIKRRNMFRVGLHEADYIYCYLNPQMMLELEKKFTEECKVGTIIISYQFKLPHLRPYRMITVLKHERIYFYRLGR